MEERSSCERGERAEYHESSVVEPVFVILPVCFSFCQLFNSAYRMVLEPLRTTENHGERAENH